MYRYFRSIFNRVSARCLFYSCLLSDPSRPCYLLMEKTDNINKFISRIVHEIQKDNAEMSPGLYNEVDKTQKIVKQFGV